MKRQSLHPPNHLEAAPPVDVEISRVTDDAITNEKLDQLEELDDTLFAAIDGDADALNRAQVMLLAAELALDQPLVEESRRQYARRAESVWQSHQRAPQKSLPSAFAALEVLELVSE